MKHEQLIVTVCKTGNGPYDRIFWIDTALFFSDGTDYRSESFSAPLIESAEDCPNWRLIWEANKWDLQYYDEVWANNIDELDRTQNGCTHPDEPSMLHAFIDLLEQHRGAAIFGVENCGSMLQRRLGCPVPDIIELKHYFMGVMLISPEKPWEYYEDAFKKEIVPLVSHYTKLTYTPVVTHADIFARHFIYLTHYRNLMRGVKENPVLYLPYRQFLLGLIFVGFITGLVFLSIVQMFI